MIDYWKLSPKKGKGKALKMLDSAKEKKGILEEKKEELYRQLKKKN